MGQGVTVVDYFYACYSWGRGHSSLISIVIATYGARDHRSSLSLCLLLMGEGSRTLASLVLQLLHMGPGATAVHYCYSFTSDVMHPQLGPSLAFVLLEHWSCVFSSRSPWPRLCTETWASTSWRPRRGMTTNVWMRSR